MKNFDDRVKALAARYAGVLSAEVKTIVADLLRQAAEKVAPLPPRLPLPRPRRAVAKGEAITPELVERVAADAEFRSSLSGSELRLVARAAAGQMTKPPKMGSGSAKREADPEVEQIRAPRPRAARNRPAPASVPPAPPPEPYERACPLGALSRPVNGKHPSSDWSGRVSKRFQDLTGKTFGAWTVESQAPSDGYGPRWRCRHACGALRVLGGTHLKTSPPKRCAECGAGYKGAGNPPSVEVEKQEPTAPAPAYIPHDDDDDDDDALNSKPSEPPPASSDVDDIDEDLLERAMAEMADDPRATGWHDAAQRLRDRKDDDEREEATA